MSLHKTTTLLFIFFSLLGFSGCDLVKPTSSVPGIDEPLKMDNIKFSVVEARVKNNYATYYIMHYPEERYTFYVITVIIEGLGEGQASLVWGRENLNLYGPDGTQELIYTTWNIIGEDIIYRSVQDFDYRYIFIFQVPQDSDYSAYQLQLKDGQNIEVSVILEVPGIDIAEEDEVSEDGEVLSPHEPSGQFAVIGGGSDNFSSAFYTTVGGGYLNTASVAYGSIGGGRENQAINLYTTVSGGYANLASGRDTTIAGGSRNTASHAHATIGGGIRNQASASDTTISGGSYNQASDLYAVVGGGTQNTASGTGSVVSGGSGNMAIQDQSTVAGGLGNRADGLNAVVAGGSGNTAGGGYSTVPGGSMNQAMADFSLASGRRSVIDPEHPGTILFADSLDSDFTSAVPNEFGVRASGGVRFVTAVDELGNPLSGASISAGSGSWSQLSDRNLKENFQTVDGLEILALVAALPISEWNYTTQDNEIRHIGPVAQDFYAAFGTGDSKRHINTVDADGVALASIQGLYQMIAEKEEQIQTLETHLAVMETRSTITMVLVLIIGSMSLVQKRTGIGVFGRLIEPGKPDNQP